MTKKKTTRKTTKPQPSNIPAGMKALGSSFAPSWKPEKEGDSVHGVVTGEVRTVEFKSTKGRGANKVEVTEERRTFEMTTHEGDRWAIWESAALAELFDQVEAQGVGVEIYIAYDGKGKKKPGQNAPNLFTAAIAA
jgi:hypothetical protein